MLEYYALHQAVIAELGVDGRLTQKQSMTLKFYLREYLHLPLQFIAEVMGIQRKHLVRDLLRIEQRSNRVNIPVSMQNRYAETLCEIDDVARELGFKPRALGNMSPYDAQQALWAKALDLNLGHMYDGEDSFKTDIESLVYKIRNFDDEADAVSYIKKYYTITDA